MLNKVQSADLDMTQETIGRWRQRWMDGQEELAAAEEQGVSDLERERMLLRILADAQRSGVPPRFGAHQMAQLFSLACRSPETYKGKLLAA